MKTLIIILIVVVICILILIGIATACLLSLQKRIAKRMDSINILMAQKYDSIVLLGKYMEEKNIVLPSELKNSLDLTTGYNMKSISTTERLSIKNILTKAVQGMLYEAELNGLGNDEKYLSIKKAINEVDLVTRKAIVNYNSDVSGFNYWRKFWLLRPFTALFRMKDKEVLY